MASLQYHSKIQKVYHHLIVKIANNLANKRRRERKRKPLWDEQSLTNAVIMFMVIMPMV